MHRTGKHTEYQLLTKDLLPSSSLHLCRKEWSLRGQQIARLLHCSVCLYRDEGMSKGMSMGMSKVMSMGMGMSMGMSMSMSMSMGEG